MSTQKIIRFSIISLIIIILIYSLTIIPTLSDNKQLNDTQNTVTTTQTTKEHYYKEKMTEKREKMIQKRIEKIEQDQEFWNYLQKEHPTTYNLLNSIKKNYPKEYKRLLLSSAMAYRRINSSNNPQIKNILSKQINNFTKLTQIFIDYKENKIDEKSFSAQATDILSTIHDNTAKIMEIRLQEFKNKKQEFINKALEKAKNQKELIDQENIEEK